MKYLLVLTSLFLLSACTVTEPYVAEYRVSPKQNKQEFIVSECKISSLKIAQAFSENSLMSKKMKYAQSEYSEFTFTESEWARSPNRAITDELIKSVRDSKLFKSVQSYKSRSSSNLILESSIEEFIQYFSSDERSSYVSVIVSLSLVDVKTGITLDTHKISERVEVYGVNAKGGVIALNAALSEVLFKTNDWLNEVCNDK